MITKRIAASVGDRSAVFAAMTTLGSRDLALPPSVSTVQPWIRPTPPAAPCWTG
jgi:hypothetical protein